MSIASLSSGSAARAGLRSAAAVVAVLVSMATAMPSSAEDFGLTQVRMYLSATPWGSLDNLCVGDRVAIDVTANRLLDARPGSDNMTNPPVQVFGVALKATASDPEVGTLSPAGQRTSAHGTPPGSGRFSFAPKKPGSTVLQFTGTESRSWFAGGDVNYLATQLTATVKECEYDVTVVSHWRQGPYLTYTALSDVVHLHYAGQPGHFVGSAAVHWLIVDSEPGCSQHAMGSTSEVDVTAELEPTGELIVDVDYGEPATGELYSYLCPDDTINSTYLFKYTPEALTTTTYPSGVTERLPQTLVDNNFAVLNIAGEVDITVMPATTE